jgi:hypothetical protein
MQFFKLFGVRFYSSLALVIVLGSGCNLFGRDEDENPEENIALGQVATLEIVGPASIKNNTCLAFQVKGLGQDGATVRSDQALTLTLSDATPSNRVGSFYSDSACATSLTGSQVTLEQEGTSVAFFYKTQYATTATLTVNATGLPQASWSQLVTSALVSFALDVSAEPPGATYTAGNCYGPYYLELWDAQDNLVIANNDAPTLVSITYDLAGGSLHGPSDTNCSGATATSSSIPAGARKTQALYFKGTSDTLVTLTHTTLNVSTGYAFPF